jgi:uncharacterized repeat protein (TIGR01451 family)
VITKEPDPGDAGSTLTPPGTATFTIVVTNDGLGKAFNVALNDQLLNTLSWTLGTYDWTTCAISGAQLLTCSIAGGAGFSAWADERRAHFRFVAARVLAAQGAAAEELGRWDTALQLGLDSSRSSRCRSRPTGVSCGPGARSASGHWLFATTISSSDGCLTIGGSCQTPLPVRSSTSYTRLCPQAM